MGKTSLLLQETSRNCNQEMETEPGQAQGGVPAEAVGAERAALFGAHRGAPAHGQNRSSGPPAGDAN